MGRKKNPQIKAAGEETPFTAEQVKELKRCARDPIYFIKKYVMIQHPTRGAVPFELYPYQEKMIRGYQENRYVVVLSARQTGKALALDTPIPTPSGWTTMGDIEVGDTVIGADGNPTTVEAVSPIQRGRKCYKLVFDTGDTVTADADHLWEVVDEYTHTVKILTTQQMVDTKIVNDKNQARYTVRTAAPINLPTSTLPIDPYVLGVWLGDGNSRTGEIVFHEDDSEIYHNVNDIYESNNRPVDKNRQHIRISTISGLRTKIRENGLLQNKHIPIIYKRASYDQRLSLLQGLMDTDGTVDGMGRGQCDITLANKQLSMDVFELVASLGLKPSYRERTVGKHVRYEVKFSAYRSQIPVFSLQRKLDLMKDAPDAQRVQSTKKRSIQQITSVDSVPVKCIRVDNEDHLFLFGPGMIPTHNSVTSAAYLLWFGMFHFDKTILIASNKNDNAMEMIQRMRFSYENIPNWLKPGVLEDGWNKHNIGFDNGSRIISTATSEDSGRGLAISLLFLDEFAFVQPGIQDEFWTAIAPTLSTGGSCIMTSTPNGDMNIFAQIWRGANIPKNMNSEVGVNDFLPIRVKWDEPPGRDEQFREEQTAKLGERKWLQEYECEFLSSDKLLIDSIFLANLTPHIDAVKPRFVIKDVVFWSDIIEGGTYLIGVDPSTGSGEDFSVITIFEFPTMKQVAEFRSNSMSTTLVYGVLKNIIKFMEKKNTTIFFSVENNGVGEGIIALFEADENPPQLAEFVSEEGKNRRGMTTTRKTKMKACVNMKEMLEKGNLEITSRVLLAELKTYARHGGAYRAQLGSTDDCISALLIVIRLLEEISTYEQAAYDKLYQMDDDEWGDSDIQEYDENSDDAPLPGIF